MGKKDDQDDWAFKLDSDVTNNTESESLMMDGSVFDDTNSSVRELKAKLTQNASKTKRKTKHKALKVDHSKRVTKKSRRAVAKELNVDQTNSSIYTQNYCTRMERMTAGTVDAAFLIAIVLGCQFLAPLINEILDEFLVVITNVISVSPELLTEYGWAIVAAALILLFYTIPSILYKASIGKSFMNIYVGKESQVGRYASIPQAFMREVFFKPISVLSVFGILMIFVNREQRSLHDRLSGTSVLKR
jgi:uncharacterized RDD family membrane protein YckC